MGSRLFLPLSLQGLPFVCPSEGRGQGGPWGWHRAWGCWAGMSSCSELV